MTKITMSIRTEPELKAKLEHITKGSGMSLSDAIKLALFRYVDDYEKERGRIPQEEIDPRAAELLKKTGKRRK